MVTLKKYNLAGEEVGTVTLDKDLVEATANPQMIKDYIVAIRANARQWSANTKGRSEVSHSTKKPHKQKGTGSARQGTLAAPQFRGGGIVFGPKPKFDQHVRINRKERRQAVRALLAQKIKNESMTVVEDAAFSTAMKKPQTKSVVAFLEKRALVGKRILFVGELASNHKNFRMGMRNIPRSNYLLAPNLNGYDVLVASALVITESALKELKDLLQ